MFHLLRRFFWYLFNKPQVLVDLIWRILSPILPDELFLKVHFYLCVGYKLNLKHPRTYNEKLQWLKLNEKHWEYTNLVDKVEVKRYVASKIGEEYIIPTIGVWNTVDEIEWDNMPERFVVKSTNDSGGVVICKDKSNFDLNAARAKLQKLGKRDYSSISKEYPYKNVPHRFIAEDYIEDESGDELRDYKFFCFDGVPEFLFVATGRQKNDTRFDFFDTDFNHIKVINGHPNADEMPVEPENFKEMLNVAHILSDGIRHVRIDLYNISGKIYFGEMTFFHWSGTVPFEPQIWDYKFGEYLHIPSADMAD